MAIKVQTLLNRAKENFGDWYEPGRERDDTRSGYISLGSGNISSNDGWISSFPEQNELYERGRTNNQSQIVTYARGGQSLHNYGLSVVFCNC
ncbi:hypothetical protein ABEZ59_21320 [Peribacillus simplex]